MDHYNTLGVAKNATPDEIKKAYRRMAGIHHPDKGGNTAEFQKIQAAYEILGDPQKKQEYDNPHHGFPGGGFPGGGFPGGGFSFHGGPDINDIIGQMFGGGAFGRQNPFQQFQQTYKTTIWVSLEQVYNGGEQMLQMQGPNGVQVVKIDIPKGVENGAQLRYDNLIPNGILLVEFRVHVHQKYERHGIHLQCTHRISVLDLIIGTSFPFTTISGKTFDVEVKPSTQPDSTLRIPGQGLPTQNGYGDQLILIKPFIPDKIDKRITDSILQHKTS
jgi:DnaJ-class molecular chaperone